ncbi:hypothetical protein ACTXT7_015136 [Hymenolepis weldensis]
MSTAKSLGYSQPYKKTIEAVKNPGPKSCASACKIKRPALERANKLNDIEKRFYIATYRITASRFDQSAPSIVSNVCINWFTAAALLPTSGIETAFFMTGKIRLISGSNTVGPDPSFQGYFLQSCETRIESYFNIVDDILISGDVKEIWYRELEHLSKTQDGLRDIYSSDFWGFRPEDVICDQTLFVTRSISARGVACGTGFPSFGSVSIKLTYARILRNLRVFIPPKPFGVLEIKNVRLKSKFYKLNFPVQFFPELL